MSANGTQLDLPWVIITRQFRQLASENKVEASEACSASLPIPQTVVILSPRRTADMMRRAPHDEKITVHLTWHQLGRIQAAAELEGVSVSEYARWVLDRSAKWRLTRDQNRQ